MQVFHAGTTTVAGKVVTHGGRVLAVSSYAQTVREAVDKAYSAMNKVHFEGMTYRKDIAHR